MFNHRQGRNHQVQVMEEATHQVQVGEEATHQVQGKRQTKEGEPPSKRGRRRPRKTPTAPPAPLTYPTLSAPPPPTTISLPTTSKKGRPRKTPLAHPTYLEHPTPPTLLPTTSKRGRPRKTPPAHPAYLEHPAHSAPPTSLPTTSKRGRGKGSESTIPYKRSSIMGISVFQAENGFKAFKESICY
ncbi:hypothetical protein KY284_013058 [Solanum tuberosum]|nr:hypothetical protein KY284_013058 [Solanum tuberosum]